METLSQTSDIIQQLLDRYGNSAAPQHRHLCATAAATRSIIQSESLPLTPLSYFAATISTLSDDQSQLDSDALAALSSFLSIVLPLVPEKAIAQDKAKDALEILVRRVKSCEGEGEVFLGTASVKALIKSLGLMLRFYDLENWDSVQLGFNTLLDFSIDKRPKVRKCAQDCVLNVLKSLKSSAAIKKASKLVYLLLENHMPLAVKISGLKGVDGLKDDIMSKPEHQEVLHVLNVLKTVVPYLLEKVCAEVLSALLKLLSFKFSVLTRHCFGIIEVIFETSKAEVIVPEADSIMKFVISYINLREKNPVDTVLSAATLSKCAIDKLHASEMNEWINHLPLVIGSIACLLNSEADTALQASNIMKELISHHIDEKFLLTIKDYEEDDNADLSAELRATKSLCDVFDKILTTQDVIPNEHILGVISILFQRLGKVSYFYMKRIVLKLAEMMTLSSVSNSETKYLEKCVGSAVVAMGPEKLLSLLPITLNSKDLSCSNTWLLPILKEYVVGSSLEFFMDHIVPLARSLQQEFCGAKKSKIGKGLRVSANKCLELLPSFCRYPTDTCKNVGALAKFLISCTKDSFMLQNIAIALQVLVNQNRNVLASDEGPQVFTKIAKVEGTEYLTEELICKHSYSKKTANKNIKALASCSKELLLALIDVMFELAPERHEYLKDAIRSLVSITDPLVTKDIFLSTLKRLQVINDFSECEDLECHNSGSVANKETNASSEGQDLKRCLTLELASSFVDGASEDLIDLLFKVTRHFLEEPTEIDQLEAYDTLSRMLERQPAFCSSKFTEVVDLLLNLKSPSDTTLLKSRFACFKTLLIHAVKENMDEEDTQTFLILNEIILTLKDSKEEGRKSGYDVLNEISLSLRNSSCVTSDEPYHKLINMVLGYLTGSSPHIKSGAISVLSVLVYNDTDLCLSIPDMVPSILALLQTRAVEVIKAILGFVKVMVSSLQAKDLQNFLPDIVNGILPWSSMSRHHFRSKVTVILEIMMRKSGNAAIRSLVPQKYGDFLKSLTENRHGKSSSKDVDVADNQSKPFEVSRIGPQKRKQEESGVLPEEEGSTGSRKRKEHKSNNPSGKEPPYKSSDVSNSRKLAKRNGESFHEKKRVSQTPWRTRDRKKSFEKGQSGTKRKMERIEATQKNKSNLHKPVGKLSKLERVGKKRLKTNK